MYRIKFTCKKLTGTKEHTILIDDRSLEDTWDSIDIGVVTENIDSQILDRFNTARELTRFTHDLNVWWDTNDDGNNEVFLSIYPVYQNEFGEILSDRDDYIRCEIIEITCDDPKSELYSKEGSEFFYPVSLNS